MNKNVKYKDLGLIEYKKAWDEQEVLLKKIIDIKSSNSNLAEDKKRPTDNYLLFCEHPNVYTLGKNGSENNMLLNLIQLKDKNATFYRTNRGGDITYHGPGQIVGYPVLDLENFKTGIRQYIYNIEEVIIRTLKEYSIKVERLDGATGVWLDTDNSKVRKICAIGVRASHWVTMHGFAFNINTDLKYFSYINPCGYTDKPVTSLEKELGCKQNTEQVKTKLKKYFEQVFDMKII